jgi:hypothetical protein
MRPRMPSVATTAYSSRGSFRQRVIAAALALLVAAVVILLLILSGIMPQVFVPVGRALSTFNAATGSASPAAAPRPKAQPKQVARQQAASPRARTMPPPVVKMEIAPPTGMIVLSKDEFAGADIGKIKGAADSGTSGGEVAGGDSKAPYGPGPSPGGKTLYAAEWVREPTRTEMATYMPRGMVEGWGMIACQTIARNRVENCRQLGESPGSGISRGMRQAAWQFLIRPPRINGRPMIGAWVSIRYDIVRGIEK